MIRVLLLLATAALLGGCAIPNASTRVEFRTNDGRRASIVIPKNLKSESLDFEFNPVTGAVSLKTKKLSTDASTVIESAGDAQANAIGELSATVRDLSARTRP